MSEPESKCEVERVLDAAQAWFQFTYPSGWFSEPIGDKARALVDQFVAHGRMVRVGDHYRWKESPK